MKFKLNKEGAKYDVVGIGNAIVDVLAHVEDDFLNKEKMTKGSMRLVDEATMLELYGKIDAVRECSGGSVANSVAALAALGARGCFMGRVRDDEFGYLFMDDLDRLGVTFNSTLAQGGKSTACCIVCVTPDGERTMNTYLGACTEMDVSDIHEARIRDGAIVYVEGYLWDQPEAKKAIRHALEIARRAKRKTAFTLSDVFCVDRHREEFKQLLRNDIDIVFANEKEARALFETENISDIVKGFISMVELAIITRSEHGVIVIHNKEEIYIPAEKVERVVDATGAGDLFAAGFLYGLGKEWELRQCAELGHRCAADIIQQIGARAQKPLQRLVA